MTYFQENSLYAYLPSQKKVGARVYNAGWLDEAVPFLTAKTSGTFRAHLQRVCTEQVVFKCKGVHRCQLCAKRGKEYTGNGEIRVEDTRNDCIWAAPQMIAHYVEVHNYHPPTDFIRAVERLAGHTTLGKV
jgi:hypothetical protein